MTDWQNVLRSAATRVFYKAVCAGCGKQRMSPVFSSQDQYCNRQCEDAAKQLRGDA